MLVKIINTILEDTYTTDELAERVSVMHEHYGALAFTPKEEGHTVLNRYGTTLDPYTLTILTRWEQAFAQMKLSPKELYETFGVVEEEMSTIPSATLYVPVHFSPEYVAGFGKWLRENTKPNLLLTMRIDSRVSGGCALIWNNVYHDFSLRYFVHTKKLELVSMVNTTIHA